MRDAKTSVALNSVSSDGRSEDRAAGRAPANRSRPIHNLLHTPGDDGRGQPENAESGAPEKEGDALRRGLIVVACAYLDACSARVSVQGEGASSDAGEELSSELRLGANDPPATV
jgi:hypothetical protein